MSLCVDRWLIAFEDTAARAKKLVSLLSEDEKFRAQQFKFPELRERFIVGRGSLRQILGRYLHCPPENIEFTYGVYGKPLVEGISFNFSHTKEYALCGITRDAAIAIGVDLEAKDRSANILGLAQRFFHEAEYAYLEQAHKSKQQDIFIKLWTAKESFLKAQGIGLQGGLDRFQICLEPQPHILCPDQEDWSLKIFPLAEHHYGAIAVNEPDCAYINRGMWTP